MLATQPIEARARQEGHIRTYTIGLSINEDPKLEKGKERKRKAALIEDLYNPPVT